MKSQNRADVARVEQTLVPSLIRLFCLFLLGCVFLLPAEPLGQKMDRIPGLHQLKPGHYVYILDEPARGASSSYNSGIIVTDEGVVVVDALGSVESANGVRKAIAGVTSQPIRYLISSSYHARYSGGNAAYQDAIQIGHENYRTDMLGITLKDASPEEMAANLPDQTYRERTTLYLGGKEIQILYFGRGHTRGDTVVFVPEDRIAYLSELYNYDEFPYISSGYGADWMWALEKIETLEADIFVPAHGYLPKDFRQTRQGLRDHWQILKNVRDAVQVQVEKGATEEETVAAVDFVEYRRFQGYPRALEIMIRRVHKELTEGLP
jgi:glyoxylase-like metal-dependent hydrolase (beta-lactamase superfamily II)